MEMKQNLIIKSTGLFIPPSIDNLNNDTGRESATITGSERQPQVLKQEDECNVTSVRDEASLPIDHNPRLS